MDRVEWKRDGETATAEFESKDTAVRYVFGYLNNKYVFNVFYNHADHGRILKEKGANPGEIGIWRVTEAESDYRTRVCLPLQVLNEQRLEIAVRELAR